MTIKKIILTSAIAALSIANSMGATPVVAEKIRFAYPSVGTIINGQVGTVLEKTDIFKKNGLDATVTSMALGKELKTALVSGNVDVVLTSESNFVVLVGQGFPCYAIGSLGRGGFMGLVANNSTYEKVSDLRAKKVGTIFGISTHQPTINWLKAAGLTPSKDVDVLNIAAIGPLRAALASKDLDAIAVFDPWYTEGIENKSFHVLKNNDGSKAMEDLDLVIVSSKEYAEKHPEAINKLKKSIAEAALHMAKNKVEVNKMYSALNGLDVKIIDLASKANPNYNAKKLSDIDLKISDRFKKKLVMLNDFLFNEKIIKEKTNILDFVR
jgi:sulfonate transport system substrate-binding protein